jgi:hypothetical protein
MQQSRTEDLGGIQQYPLEPEDLLCSFGPEDSNPISMSVSVIVHKDQEKWGLGHAENSPLESPFAIELRKPIC